jgi:hypothetical protein
MPRNVPDDLPADLLYLYAAFVMTADIFSV